MIPRSLCSSVAVRAAFHRRSEFAILNTQKKGHGAVSLASVAKRKLMHHEQYATPWRHTSLTM